jgi:deaminated glutathione amidase
MKVTIIQLNSKNNKAENLWQVEQFITQACEQAQPDLIALPEMFSFMGGSLDQKKNAAEIIDDSSSKNDAILLLKDLANQFKVFIHGGSLCEFFEGHYFNTTCIIDNNGDLIATYRKINLFNFSGSGQVLYNERALLTPGNEVVTYNYERRKIGCAICFDLRFSCHFQQLLEKQVEIIIIPSAFTYETGKAHWEILCRARAIETQTFLIAPAQTGQYSENGKEKACWGHSMIVDPWGNILAQMNEEPGFTSAVLDFDFLTQVRSRLPLQATLKEDCYPTT